MYSRYVYLPKNNTSHSAGDIRTWSEGERLFWKFRTKSEIVHVLCNFQI